MTARNEAHLVELICREDFWHAVRICRISSQLGHALGIRGQALFDLETAALLHDLGKLLLPDAVLKKRTQLTGAEFEVVKRHPSLGVQVLLAGVPAPVQAQLGMPERFVRLTESTRRLAVTVAATHHERLDGSGYPHGLVGDEITLAARIVAVADVYDALRSNRCYRQSLSVAETLGIVRKDAQAGRLDGRVVEELERRVERIERDLAGPLPDEESIWFRLGAV